jgi:hypothetical protein
VEESDIAPKPAAAATAKASIVLRNIRHTPFDHGFITLTDAAVSIKALDVSTKPLPS